MIPVMSRSAQIVGRLRLLLRRCVLLGFSRLPTTVGPLLLRFVMRVCFLVVVAALPAEKEQNLLSVAAGHTASVRSWPRAVKRIILPPKRAIS